MLVATMRAAFIKCLLSVRRVSEHLKHVNAFVLTARLQDGYRFLQHIYQRRNGGPRCWATCQSRSHRQSDSSSSSSPVCCVKLQETEKWCFLYAMGMFGLFHRKHRYSCQLVENDIYKIKHCVCSHIAFTSGDDAFTDAINTRTTNLRSFPGGSEVKHLLANAGDTGEMQVGSLGQEDPLEEGIATHSSTLAWEIPWTEEPGGLQSMGSQRVGHNWATVQAHTHFLSSTHFPRGLHVLIQTSRQSKGRRIPWNSIQAPTKNLQGTHKLQGYVYSTSMHHSPLGRKQLNHFPARSPWMSPKELGTELWSLDPLAEFQKANLTLTFSWWDILFVFSLPCNICNPNTIARVRTWITGKKIGSQVKVPAPNAERIKLNLARFNKGCHKKSSLRFSLPNHQY